MPEVNCTVCNCNYWQQGNLCSASSILITSGRVEGKDPHGSNAAILEGVPIGRDQESFCLTFEARDAHIEDADEAADQMDASRSKHAMI